MHQDPTIMPASLKVCALPSLKAYAPVLAWRLGMTPAALYERQRALVRDGILQQPEGRGPGSGVQVHPFAVALLLVAVLATDSLSETADKVRTFATAKSTARDGRCPLTRRQTFVEAMALVLDPAHEHWRKIVDITVHRTTGSAVIRFGDSLSSTASTFAAQAKADAKLPAPTKLAINATLMRDLIMAIVMDLRKIADSQQRGGSALLQLTAESEQEPIQARKKKKVSAAADDDVIDEAIRAMRLSLEPRHSPSLGSARKSKKG
jgi:hypothetical protein